jgi:hypothetical protein
MQNIVRIELVVSWCPPFFVSPHCRVLANRQAGGGVVQGATDAVGTSRSWSRKCRFCSHDSFRAAHPATGNGMSYVLHSYAMFLLVFYRPWSICSAFVVNVLICSLACSVIRRGSGRRTTSSSSAWRPWSSRRTCATVRNELWLPWILCSSELTTLEHEATSCALQFVLFCNEIISK